MESSPQAVVDFSRSSYDTALCLMPPRELWDSIDNIRSSHDKAWPRWPPHINLVYPFVLPDLLPAVVEVLSRSSLTAAGILQIDLQQADTFVHRKKNTIYLRPLHGYQTALLADLVNVIRQSLGLQIHEALQPHMTMGQSQHVNSAEHNRLIEMAQSIAPITWETSELAILIRDAGGRMRLWGSLGLLKHGTSQLSTPRNLYENLKAEQKSWANTIKSALQPAFHFCESKKSWTVVSDSPSSTTDPTTLDRLVVASFNVSDYSAQSSNTPRSRTLIDDLLCDRATADVLVLQGVNNEILSAILNDNGVQKQFRYSTHITPDPNTGKYYRHNLILSKWVFQKQEIDLQNGCNGCMVAKFPTVQLRRSTDGDEKLPLAIVACHLENDLSDDAISVAQKSLQTIKAYLNTECSQYGWVLAGDFGLPTSSVTIRQAYEEKTISNRGLRGLLHFSSFLSILGFMDSWSVTRLGIGESSGLEISQEAASDLDEGEQAPTFGYTPHEINSSRPAESKRWTVRPQRYARILVGKQSWLQPSAFNIFGAVIPNESGDLSSQGAHRGIRSLLTSSVSSQGSYSDEAMPVQPQAAPFTLVEMDDLEQYMETYDLTPLTTDRTIRMDSFRILERVLLGKMSSSIDKETSPAVTLALTTIGSFGLGVWSKSSTINCLCIGNISSKTFFALATQRFKREQRTQISNLRRGKGSAGPKFEFGINGVRFDLYYCAATSISEKWPEVMRRPSSDPIFNLPFETMAQLKPARDLYYLRKSIPDMAQYRVVHVAIRLWAQSRGIFDSAIGLLGDSHITALLVPVCKLLAFDGRNISAADVIATFFSHYAEFEWATKPVFDPFFHRKLAYRRSFRESLCLLGWHPPALNTATNLTNAAVDTMAIELKRAQGLLSQKDLTWRRFFGPHDEGIGSLAVPASLEFLQSYRVYARIETRYWGLSSMKCGKIVHRLRSELAKMLLDIDKKLPAVKARVWPTPFAETAMEKCGNDYGSEYHANHLVGLELRDAQSATDEESQLEAIIRGLDRRMSEHYDARVWWMRSSLTWSDELQSLGFQQMPVEAAGDPDALDSDDCDSMTDEEYEEWDEEIVHQTGDRATHDGAPLTTLTTNIGKGSAISSPSHNVDAKADRKLRSAADVMNRLRWDPGLDVSNYAVGYVDRFKGTQEKPLEQWKSEQTDEDFIPQHRILYFKRIADGAVMWDRRSRIDEVFGSGVDLGDPAAASADKGRGAG